MNNGQLIADCHEANLWRKCHVSPNCPIEICPRKDVYGRWAQIDFEHRAFYSTDVLSEVFSDKNALLV